MRRSMLVPSCLCLVRGQEKHRVGWRCVRPGRWKYNHPNLLVRMKQWIPSQAFSNGDSPLTFVQPHTLYRQRAFYVGWMKHSLSAADMALVHLLCQTERTREFYQGMNCTKGLFDCPHSQFPDHEWGPCTNHFDCLLCLFWTNCDLGPDRTLQDFQD